MYTSLVPPEACRRELVGVLQAPAVPGADLSIYMLIYLCLSLSLSLSLYVYIYIYNATYYLYYYHCIIATSYSIVIPGADREVHVPPFTGQYKRLVQQGYPFVLPRSC